MTTVCIEFEALKIEMAETQDQIKDLRRGIYANFDAMTHEIMKLEKEMHKLKNCVDSDSEETVQKNILMFPNFNQAINDS